MEFVVLQGALESVAGVVVSAGAVVLMLMLVALVTYVYKQTRGGGVTWPSERDDVDASNEDGVTRGSNDDEWKYY
ncbi:hypothetical protein VB773_15465 [Haloarculaceae archaeon H-GB2-1]|nr:hypothetical protein [Haloarculaceae archaeon H-GB1-1]MEA5387356.1 hypothetical protein [Haloarculaceae archaeon H-GB11]MEA5408825.1 hypothetical protein [Haloarculaceae archaeon H-GB2-1]